MEFPDVSPDSPEPPVTEEVTSDSESVASEAVSYSGDISEEEDHDADQMNFFINRFDALEYMTNDTECIAEEDVEHFARGLGGAHPFPDIQSMVLQSFINGDDDVISERLLKKILYMINILMMVKDQYTEEKMEFRLPRLDALINFMKRKRNNIPIFPATTLTIENKDEEKVDVSMNLPSSHLELLVANPKKCDLITALPDFTPDQSINLQQGEKWKTHNLFQQPFVKINNYDYWVGDCVVYTMLSPLHHPF
ncbi:hypothetical protein BC941DRAFT_191523 [Chlamydoabsidia padenii]|nr:hypothetical protein BC941DRAFT_191523 [Chlamydoabsidia padenii]